MNPESQHAACAKWTFLEPKMQNKTNNNHPPRVQTEHTGICLHTPRVQTEHTGILLHTPRVQTEHTGIVVAHAAAPGGGWVGCFFGGRRTRTHNMTNETVGGASLYWRSQGQQYVSCQIHATSWSQLQSGAMSTICDRFISHPHFTAQHARQSFSMCLTLTNAQTSRTRRSTNIPSSPARSIPYQ